MKKTFLYALSSVIILSNVLYACSDDPMDDDNCVDTDISYADDVDPIIQNSCALSGCHAGPNPADGIDLDDYNVVRFVANNGTLLGSIKHQSGFHNMPQGSSKLPDCTIAKIESWVNDGALNN